MLNSAQDVDPKGLPKLVGVDELARAIGRHPQTIRRWGRHEGLPYHQPGGAPGRWLIDVDEFRAWLRNRCFANGTPEQLRIEDAAGTITITVPPDPDTTP